MLNAHIARVTHIGGTIKPQNNKIPFRLSAKEEILQRPFAGNARNPRKADMTGRRSERVGI